MVILIYQLFKNKNINVILNFVKRAIMNGAKIQNVFFSLQLNTLQLKARFLFKDIIKIYILIKLIKI